MHVLDVSPNLETMNTYIVICTVSMHTSQGDFAQQSEDTKVIFLDTEVIVINP